MVRRSLVLKIFLYAVGALFVTFVLAFGASRLIMAHGLGDAYRQLGADYGRFMARQVESSLVDGRPDLAKLEELERSLHVTLAFIPREAIPAELAEREWTSAHAFGSSPVYWVRLDPAGKTVGALRITYHPPQPAAGRIGGIFAVCWMLTVGVMLIPPLYIWVIRPLRSMVDTANRLGRDLETPVTIDRKDEFGDLEAAFESLRQRIQRMLTQKERLLTDISHEMRGPLSRMAIALPLVRADGESSPYLDHIERNMHAMDRLIGELTALSRGQNPPERYQEPLDLAELTRDLVAERALVMEQKDMVPEVSLAPAPVMGDRLLVERAIGNLLDNAIKYGKAPLLIATGRDGRDALFSVRDHGPGVPETDLPHLFEPFYRPDASRSRQSGGIGLGLAIVKTVAESHHGAAVLQSREGHGTTASFRLPLREG